MIKVLYEEDHLKDILAKEDTRTQTKRSDFVDIIDSDVESESEEGSDYEEPKKKKRLRKPTVP